MYIGVYNRWVNGQCFNDGEVSWFNGCLVGLVKDTSTSQFVPVLFVSLKPPSSSLVYSEPAPVLGSESIPNSLAGVLGFRCLAQL